ncbi:hypothetical protein HY631_01440 [Candidatus Uhrbacteria bacterium]|nr:hypothetical protein [Candidatus Uhrbacteria bacterium]
MSIATLRYHAITLSFLPSRREERVLKSLRTLRLRTSRRRTKQIIRYMMSRVTKGGLYA